ncbi:MAG: hypothetical protein M3O31_14365 [Acidobacteriota bacterium]|nr:hypothetical protein [Acidobacteriota bacterium]
MTNESSSSDIRDLWQSQPTEPPRISLEDLRGKMQKFERRIFWRNIREYAGGVFVVAAFGFCEWKLPALLLRLGSGLTIAGALYVMFQLHRRASIHPAPADLGLKTCLQFHRQSLERQLDALRTVWSWYLLPFIPGLAVFFMGTAVNQWTAHPVGMGQLLMGYGILVILVGAVFLAVWKLNQRAADKLQAQIDEMTELCSPPENGERLC